MTLRPRLLRSALAFAAAVGLGTLGLAAFSPPPADPPAAAQAPRTTFKSGLELVVVNVVVRDKDGKLVRGLGREDFVVLEDGRPQTVSSFDFEEIENASLPSMATTTVLGAIAQPGAPAAAPASGDIRPAVDMKDRRLIVLFYDLGSMQPEEVSRAVQSGRDYVEKKMAPADILAVVSLTTALAVDQDFTADRPALLSALNRLSPVEGSAAQAGADAEIAPDTGNAFVADDTEFNIFSTDRRLDALRAVADVLAGIEQKKSVIYFSGGVTQSGMDNQAAVRTLVDRAVRANVSIYAADTRGLAALPAGGDASTASVRGTGAFSGRAMSSQRESFSAAQDTLSTIAEDTGGKAFFDVNEFAEVFDTVVEDTSSYYLLGYTSTNPARDGRFRRIRVSLKQPGLKLEFRSGYYAPRDFAHSGRDDRAQQMQEQLLSDLPLTDLPVHGSAGYFRLKENRYFVPVWFIVPGSQVQFSRASDREKATLDVLGVIRDGQNRPVAWIQDTVKLSVAATEEVQRRNVQYGTSFELPPGLYRLKVVIRENQLGTFGSFDSTLVVPNLDRNPLRLSSVVLASQRQPVTKKNASNPLQRDGQELVANVARVVTAAQPMVFYYEVYDPGKPAAPVRVLSNIAFYKGSQRVLQTELVTAQQVNLADRKAVSFEMIVPAGALAPGLYTCQVNVVDDTAGTFAFPRFQLYVRK
ncbi:MAG TPA: VWA domain-containing protein [Vicinamibacterales bacterium]|nr:VWA domain-containing protein [Vicinamibacterales bacterium]